jgi:predicted aspartyl protease
VLAIALLLGTLTCFRTGNSEACISPTHQDDDRTAKLRRYLEANGYVVVQLDRLRAGYLAGEARLEGKPLYLMVDSGAPFTALDPKRIVKFGLKPPKHETTLDWVHGSSPNLEILTLEVGGVKAGRLMAHAYDLSEVAKEDLGLLGLEMVDGLLGLDAMERYGAIIDLSTHRMYLHSKVHQTELERFLKAEGYISVLLKRLLAGYQAVEARLEGKNLSLLVDTGAPISGLDPQRIAKLGLRTSKHESLPKFPNGTWPNWEILTLEIGGIKAGKLMVSSCDLTQMNEGLRMRLDNLADGLLGLDALSRYGAILDISANRLYLPNAGQK